MYPYLLFVINVQYLCTFYFFVVMHVFSILVCEVNKNPATLYFVD